MSTVDEGLADFWAVVPAGGVGTRLWPMSRSGNPKFLLDVVGTGRSLLQSAFDRLTPLCDNRFMVVTGASHVGAVSEQLPELVPGSLLAEPAPRDSMAAIGLAAAVLEHRDPDLIMGSFPADHVIPDAAGLHECIRQGYAAARTGLLSLIGLEPTRPTSALGYIRTGAPLDIPGAPLVRSVEAFVEKPDEARARQFMDTGGHLWNAGMWIVKAGVLMNLLASRNPRMADDLRTIAAHPEKMPEIWESIERATIDHTIAEPLAGSPAICIVPGKFEWDDIGDFHALRSFLRERDPSVAVHTVSGGDRVVDVDSSGVVVATTGRTITVVGLPDIVVVDTPDALLVMHEDYAQDLKRAHTIVTGRHPEVG